MKELAEVFKALSDKTRIQIMAMLLMHGELCVCDVEGALEISQSKSSRHLRYLLHARLVENWREGVWMHYRVPKQQTQMHKVLFFALRKLFAEEDLVDLRKKLDQWLEKKSCSSTVCKAS